jgi:hypothetical protein
LPWENLIGSRLAKWWFTPVVILEFQVGSTKIRLRIPEQYKENVAQAKGSYFNGLKEGVRSA